MTSWWGALRRWQERRAIARRSIPDALWAHTEARFPFLRQPDLADATRLREMSSLFLEAKQFSGAHGFEVTDEMAVAVAAQACLPVLHLGLAWYDSFVGIVVHEGELATRRERTDDHGVVHHFDDVFSGEAMPGGPVTLSWQDILMAGTDGEWAYGVVIHEMAHVLDMRNGEADGMPPLASRAQQARWHSAATEAYDMLCCQVQGGRTTAIDPYAAESPDEFFAVACESFFITPRRLKAGHPALYAELQSFFRQDPAAHMAQPSSSET
jgi:Mlc titration factor MtfA (ptsG expression regulator)